MPKPKNSKNKSKKEIKVKAKKSSLSEFVKRSLPTDEEVEKFDEYAEEEVRDGSIEDSLSEIYQDDDGSAVDVKTLNIKKKKGFFFWFFAVIFAGFILAAAAYGVYYVYYEQGSSSGEVQFSIEGKENILSGEEFFYIVNYKNLSNIAIGNIEIKLAYPDNFMFLDSAPAARLNNDLWQINNLDAHRSGLIRIKGRIVGPANKTNIITGNITYTPANFSSQFKKEAAFENKISGTGIEFSIESPSGALVGEESEIIVRYKAREENFINNFRLTVEPLENMEFISGEEENAASGVWQVGEIGAEEKEVSIKFKITEKREPEEELVLKFEYPGCSANGDGIGSNENYCVFYEEKINFEVIKSDLNLNLIINGSQSDQGVDLGQTMNYSIVYANKGDSEMEDIIIMAVLNSEALDWQTLDDDYGGQIGDNIISWSKDEIPELESLDTGEEGVIDFSVKVKSFEEIEIEPGKKYGIESYAQFSIGNIEPKENEDTKSNTIINKINSDLSLDEQVRYFNDDNIAVGFGPLPPKVGEMTSYKVYWTITNNLHELNDLRIQADLPDYVNWDDKNRSTAGTVEYSESDRKVIWNIGRLPISVYKAEAEFSISITPTEADVDKIMVLLSNTTVEAVDVETKTDISKTTKAKTTRLEDDEIAETDGRVVR